MTTALSVPLPAAEQASLPCSSPSSTITSDWTSLLSYTKYAYIVRYFSCGSGHHNLSCSGLINLRGYVNIIKIPIIKKACGCVSQGFIWTNKKIGTIYFLVFPQLKFGNNWISTHCIKNAYTVRPFFLFCILVWVGGWVRSIIYNFLLSDFLFTKLLTYYIMHGGNYTAMRSANSWKC